MNHNRNSKLAKYYFYDCYRYHCSIRSIWKSKMPCVRKDHNFKLLSRSFIHLSLLKAFRFQFIEYFATSQRVFQWQWSKFVQFRQLFSSPIYFFIFLLLSFSFACLLFIVWQTARDSRKNKLKFYLKRKNQKLLSNFLFSFVFLH